MPELVVEAFESTVTMTTSGTLDSVAVPSVSTSAQAVFTVDLDDMKSVFQFQTDSADVLDVSASDIKFYTTMTNWPTLNAGNAMMDHTASVSPIATGLAANKMMVAHDFTRYLAQELFGTYHGVDLFNNETALLQNLRVILGSGSDNTMGDITTALTAVSTTGTHAGIATDGSGNKYMTSDQTANTNIARELYRQLASTVPSRFASFVNQNTNQAFPFLADDIISFKVTINPASGQHALTSVSELAARSYKIKLILKATADVSNTAVDSNEE